MTPLDLKAHRAKLRKLGICTRCHKEPTGGINKLCKTCISDLNETRDRKREAGGYCHFCTRKLDEFTTKAGGAHCPSCLEAHNQKRLIRRTWK